jgi:hypothetical protein
VDNSDVRKIDKIRHSMSQAPSERPISTAKRSTLADVISNINAVTDRDKFRAAKVGNLIDILLDLIESDESTFIEKRFSRALKYANSSPN